MLDGTCRAFRRGMRIAWITFVLAICTPSHAEPPVDPFKQAMMARFHMHEGYALYAAVERLILRRNLDDAKDLAKLIGIIPAETGLTAWAPQIATVRTRALALADAPSLEEASRRAARLADACARCHLDSNAAPEFRRTPALPPDVPTIAGRMARHIWAVERIREGIVGGVDEPWRAGLDVLASAPLPWSAADGDRAALAKQIQRLADVARHRGPSDTSDERARMYGEILVTCSACHGVNARRR